MVIFDCNGVLVDSETLATSIVSQEFMRAGFALTPDIVARYFTGRRPADMFADVEQASGRKLPPDFAATVTSATLRRFRAELRAGKHASYALSWLRGPKCVASSSSLDRIRVSLETTDLIRFFEPNLFSAGDVRNGKPAPDLFLHAACKMLRSTKKSLATIAEECGFTDPTSMSRDFRQELKINPRAYRTSFGEKKRSAGRRPLPKN